MSDHKNNLDSYSIVIATGIIRNAKTNNVSLIEVLDHLPVFEPMLGQGVPLNALFRLKGEAKQMPARFLWVGADGKTYPSHSDETPNLDVEDRAAIELNALKLPPTPGEYKLVIEFWEARGEGGRWVRGSASAPFVIQLMRPVQAGASAVAPS
jgi:hypothetical protein